MSYCTNYQCTISAIYSGRDIKTSFFVPLYVPLYPFLIQYKVESPVDIPFNGQLQQNIYPFLYVFILYLLLLFIYIILYLEYFFVLMERTQYTGLCRRPTHSSTRKILQYTECTHSAGS